LELLISHLRTLLTTKIIIKEEEIRMIGEHSNDDMIILDGEIEEKK